METMKTKFLELHLLQNFPPSCINRDGNNAPKDCQFGGVKRARISSQSQKRAIRTDEEFESTVDVAKRTKLNIARATEALREAGASADVEAQAEDMVTKLSKLDPADKEKDPAKKRTAVLLFFGPEEWKEMATGYIGKQKDWHKLAKPRSADVLLFGRMLAELPDLNVDACCQVAHAISTHQVETEFDFWSAVDDLQPKEEAGAGMLGAAEFNSACFYRYACLNLRQLAEAYGDEEMAKTAAIAFIRAAYSAIPTGKQNAYAHFTPPDFAMVVVREKGAPLNLVNAFEQPVATGKFDKGLTERSARYLDEYYGRKNPMMPYQPTYVAHCRSFEQELPNLGQKSESFDAFIKGVAESI